MRTVIPKNAKLIPAHAECVFKGKIFDVYQWKQEMFDGSFEIFEMLRRPDTLKVIAVKDGKLVVLKEEQPGHSAFFDIPGGRHDHEKETELQAAQRELQEETGMVFDKWTLLETVQPHSKIDWIVYIFLATDFEKQIEANLDSGEKIETHLVEFNKAKKLLSGSEGRHMPQVLEKVSSLGELIALPEKK